MGEFKKTSERFEFACHVIDEFRRCHARDDVERHVWRELLRAGTSVAANAAESDGSGSDRDFASKFQIALKEARESLLWLRLAKHAGADRGSQLDALYKECDTIVAVLVASLKTVKSRRARAH